MIIARGSFSSEPTGRVKEKLQCPASILPDTFRWVMISPSSTCCSFALILFLSASVVVRDPPLPSHKMSEYSAAWKPSIMHNSPSNSFKMSLAGGRDLGKKKPDEVWHGGRGMCQKIISHFLKKICYAILSCLFINITFHWKYEIKGPSFLDCIIFPHKIVQCCVNQSLTKKYIPSSFIVIGL